MGSELFRIPISKAYSEQEGGNTLHYIEGVISTTGLDRDTEKMSEKALYKMQRDILERGVNLFSDHEHAWENTIGVLKSSNIKATELYAKFLLDDPETNPKVKQLLSKMERGFKLGFSVGGRVLETTKEFDKALHKDVTIIDDLELYEVSLVGIPANPACMVEGISSAFGKSAYGGPTLPSQCNACFSKSINLHKGLAVCDDCLTPTGVTMKKSEQMSSELPPTNYKETLLEQPSYNNTLPQQTCPFCGSLDSELVADEQARNVYWCNNCRNHFKWEQNVRTGNFAISQPSHTTGRGVGVVQENLPNKMPSAN